MGALIRLSGFTILLLALAGCAASTEVGTAGEESAAAPPETPALESWNDVASKQAIVDFVTRVSDPASPDFVPEAERIATFDNDGTLWSEQPMYFQVLFAIDRVREMADDHPQWREEQPFKGAIEGDFAAMAASR